MVTIELIGFLGYKNLDFKRKPDSLYVLMYYRVLMQILAKCLYVYNIIYQTSNKKES